MSAATGARCDCGADVDEVGPHGATCEAGHTATRDRDGLHWRVAVSTDSRTSTTIRVSDVQPERVSWLWHGRIPLGKLTVLDGDPGLGKSTLALDIAARVTTGREMPDGIVSDITCPAGVVLLSAEDGLADTIRPRLDAAGADCRRVLALMLAVDPTTSELRPPTIGDLLALEEAIKQVDARYVVIDPLMAYLSDDTRSFQDQSIRRALAPLAALAERLEVAILLVRHLNKSAGGSAIYRGGGSIGIVGAARSGLLVAADPDDTTQERRILASVKSNLGRRPDSLAYRLDEAPNGVARITWLGPSAHTANQLLSTDPAEGERERPLDAAAEFLREVLADGPRPSREVQADAKDAGISFATLRRARERLCRARKVGAPGSAEQAWYWFLREDVHFTNENAEDVYPSEVNIFGESEHLRENDTIEEATLWV